jgi:hypothetical protein
MKTRSLFDQLMTGVGTAARPREGALALPTRQEDPPEDFADTDHAASNTDQSTDYTDYTDFRKPQGS